MSFRSNNHALDDKLMGDAAFRRLLQQHEALETRLSDELKHPAVDWDGVRLIKRQKLAIFDQLEELRQRNQIN